MRKVDIDLHARLLNVTRCYSRDTTKSGKAAAILARASARRRTISRATSLRIIPTIIEEALAELKRDPANAVHARIDGMDVDLRAVPPSPASDEKLGDWMASAGPWQGETEEEILEILREARPPE
jgi:hypothetical protein